MTASLSIHEILPKRHLVPNSTTAPASMEAASRKVIVWSSSDSAATISVLPSGEMAMLRTKDGFAKNAAVSSSASSRASCSSRAAPGVAKDASRQAKVMELRSRMRQPSSGIHRLRNSRAIPNRWSSKANASRR